MSARQRGLSLVELMVAMVIGLILMAGVTQVYLSNRQTSRIQEAASRLQENGRFSIQFLARDIREAGYGGCRKISEIAVNVISDTVQSELGDALEAEDVVTGVNDAPAGDPVENPWNASEGTDVIRVRGASSGGAPLSGNMGSANAEVQVERNAGRWEADDVLFIADCQQADIFTATNVSQANGQVTDITIAHANNTNTTNRLSKTYDENAEVMSFTDITFFVRDTGDIAQDGKPLRGLYRKRNGEPAQELLRGIDDMQIVYGRDSDGDGLVDEYFDASELSSIAWAEVMAVRVELLFSSDQPNIVADPQPYFFDDEVVGDDPDEANLISDRRLRRVFTTTATLRNRAP